MTRSSYFRCLIAALAMVAAFSPVAAAAEPAADSLGLDWSQVPEYRVVPGDELTLNFGPRPDFYSDYTRQVVVRPDGRITVFPVGDVVAAGHTPSELEATLVALLAPDLKQPRVVVEVSKMISNKVHVLGEVTSPGSYPVEPFMTVIQAITAAGGFKNDAARNSVLVFSRVDGRSVRVAEVRVRDVLKKGLLVGDLPLSRFDIVYVPRSTIGNLNQFATQFFDGVVNPAMNSIFTGWELFHLDRVFVVGTTKR